MSVEVSYYGKDGKERALVLEEGDDTNLMFGSHKADFSLFRSMYKDDNGDKRYEFWAKMSGQFFAYSYRPSGRPTKVKFDSCRTAIAGYLGGESYPYSNRDGMFYMGGEETNRHGNFSVYGCVVKGKRFYDTRSRIPYEFECMAIDRPFGGYSDVISFLINEVPNTIVYDYTGRYVEPHGIDEQGFSMTFSGKVAEVRDWEIVSNDTPEENTYYVVVENKKGDIVDVITTHGFGQTVNVGGKDYVVKYDMVIRPGR